MSKVPNSISRKLLERGDNNSLRKLSEAHHLIDFSSNDYLGFAKSAAIFEEVHDYLSNNNISQNGATGSRLISGNHSVYQQAEGFIAKFHQAESALIYNSGYDANLGFFSSVPQRNDIVLYDALSHASIRDGIRLGNAKSLRFGHNDLEDLEQLIVKHQIDSAEIYIVTESVFSMDGDSPDLERLAALSEKYSCQLVIDEAHALGVFGEKGVGLVQQLNLQKKIFARIMTFGKGLGCHGAAILGASELIDYLVNFSRSFIYTTGLPPHAVATILTAYKHLEREGQPLEKLKDNILFFNQEMNSFGLKQLFVRGKSAIRSAIIPGNETVKQVASKLQQAGFDVKPILSPTVSEGQERLRICIHSYNTQKEISDCLNLLSTFVIEQ